MDCDNAQKIWRYIEEYLGPRTLIVATNDGTEAARFQRVLALG
jgi:ABC-type transport system involved in cytochrome bd biosynthesis fused ATPase/permease subunit